MVVYGEVTGGTQGKTRSFVANTTRGRVQERAALVLTLAKEKGLYDRYCGI